VNKFNKERMHSIVKFSSLHAKKKKDGRREKERKEKKGKKIKRG